MNAKSSLAGLPSREISITRIIAAPPALVFKAWLDPKQLAEWWGPKVFTNPVCEVDPRVGGKWRIVMRAPDGTEYPCGGEYREIVYPTRLVFTNCAMDKEDNRILDGITTVNFATHQGKTMLILTTRATAMVDYAAAYLTGMEAGWTQSLDKLQAEFPEDEINARTILVSRIVSAPQELVWDAITDPKKIVHWWGPRGFTNTIEVMDLRPGGQWKHIMHGPDGTDYPNESVFEEITKPSRLVFTHTGGKLGGPSADFRSTWTFDALGPSMTVVTIRMVFANAQVRDAIAESYGAVEGGHQTLGRLDEFVQAGR